MRTRKLSSDNIDTVPSIEDIESPAAVSIAAEEIRKFLKRVVTANNTDVIISTMRKGSWIIDDLLRIDDLKIKHYTNEMIPYVISSEPKDRRILIFDDSVRTGNGITTILSSFGGYDHVRVACIVINEKALETIEKNGVSVDYLEKFKEYTSFGGNGELLSGCQAYYYAYFMIPYISALSVNYSPDYRSLSITVAGGSPRDLRTLTDLVAKTFSDDEKEEVHEIDRTMYTRRLSVSVDGKRFGKYLSDLGITYETDLSKLRISASVYKDRSEVVVTPVFCPICYDVDGVDMKDLLLLISERFIDDNRERIIGSLNKKGFNVVHCDIITGAACTDKIQKR